MALTAFVALGVLVYTYVLYPIAIAVCARVWPMRVRRDPGHQPKVTAIIPVYNAAQYVRGKLDSLLAQEYPTDRLQIILCSDCSDDGSDEILQEYADAHPQQIVFLRAKERAGKPTAVNLMKGRADGDILLMTDIRQPLNKGCVRELVSHFSDPSVGAVSGNLILQGGTGAGAYWKYENWIRSSEGHFRSMVGVTGPIYAIAKEDMDEVPTDIILDDMWVPLKLRLRRKRIVFAPEAHAYDDAFGDKREFGRKVRTLAGNYQLFARMPALLVPFVNPSWFEVFSHKILRLICPWAGLLLLVSSLLGVLSPSGDATETLLLQVLLAGQGAFYGLALAGPAAGRLGGLARTFVVLNYAAILGLWRFVSGGQRVTW